MEIVISRKLKKTPVYDAYWKFACERMTIYYKRVSGDDELLTKDDIIKKHKFTNAYRAIDRISQYLIKEIIRPDEDSDRDYSDRIFRILLFKTFNKIETWESLEHHVGDVSWRNYDFERFNEVLSKKITSNQRIYSAAYIMASGKKSFGYERKHENHLKLLEYMIKDELAKKITDCKNMESLYHLLKKYPTIGEFLAYQYATDINYSSITDFSEMEFVKAGPGSIDGISKCFLSNEGYSPEDIIKHVTENQDYEFERLGLSFQNLYGRKLKLIDCQNLFCETGKYARIAYPEYPGVSKRKKIKQLFRPTSIIEQPCLPEKWNIDFSMER
tara:strand:+ start:222 stop:1208 length:987 start_codon:yes stop_codon:yes gene_type:complete